MRTLKLVVSYDGTAYLGWQLQPNGVTVQQVLEAAIEKILGPHRTIVAGRTDAGVHALGQVVSLRTGLDPDRDTLLRALNANLPEDVVVRSIDEVPNEFDPVRHAIGKLYRYRFFDGPVRPVLERHFVWQVWNLDWDAMAEAAKRLVGTHDFSSFRDAGAETLTSVRTIDRIELLRRPPETQEVWLEVEGKGFLKHMVRNIAGTLFYVGRRFHPPDWVTEVLEAKDRRRAGPTAPARGLTLVEVRYPPAQ